MLTTSQIHRSTPQVLTRSTFTEAGTGKATEDFSKLISTAGRRLQQAISSRRNSGVTSPINEPKTQTTTSPAKSAAQLGPGQVVVSPFNLLGLPISGTLAPTAAEVAANPAKYAGTSFDPNIKMQYNYPTVREWEIEQGIRTW